MPRPASHFGLAEPPATLAALTMRPVEAHGNRARSRLATEASRTCRCRYSTAVDASNSIASNDVNVPTSQEIACLDSQAASAAADMEKRAHAHHGLSDSPRGVRKAGLFTP